MSDLQNSSSGRKSGAEAQPVFLALITRYNLRIKFSGVEKFQDPLDPNWLADRKRLFERFCAPSVRFASGSRSKWFILFDKDTPRIYIDNLLQFADFEPILAGGWTEAYAAVQGKLSEEGGYVCTLRLDSDDSLEAGFLEAISKYAEHCKGIIARDGTPVVISVPQGREYDVSKGQFYTRNYPGNPFLAVCESASDNVQTVFMHAHYDLIHRFPTIMTPNGTPSWCINVHGGNAANEIKSGIKCDKPEGLSFI